jgi:DNA polymerase
MNWLVFDVETFSESDLPKAGAFEYSKHPSTEILCLAFRFAPFDKLTKTPTELWEPWLDNHLKRSNETFGKLLAALRDPKVNLVAHNAFFEQNITRNVFGPRYMRSIPELQNIPIERWYCTASYARAVGLPGKLEEGCQALKLPHQKDMEGHRLMLKLSKPRKPSKKNPETRWNNPQEYERLSQYCATDVDATVDLLMRVPPLCEVERKFWILDQKMNHRGFAVDRKLVRNVLPLIANEKHRLDLETKRLTKGKLNSVRQRDAVLKFLEEDETELPNLKSKTVKDWLAKNPAPCLSRSLLEIREALSRSSTSKYKAFEVRSRFDSRARDNTIYFGAHTGRQSGTGLQPQNLFKTVIPQKDVELGVELVHANDRHLIEALFDKPMDLYASALRSAIVAPEGSVLDVGDFATIEVRVLFWLAGHTKGLEALASGRDLYIEMAAVIHRLKMQRLLDEYKAGKPLAKIMRQLGKQTVLGAGFGIGINGEKFQATCLQYGIEISLELAQRAIRAYRDLHPRIPAFWTNIEKAAILALENEGKSYRIGYLVWEKKGDWLNVHLPIGRKLSYFKAGLRKKQTPWGVKKNSIILVSDLPLRSSGSSLLGAESSLKMSSRAWRETCFWKR